MATKGQPMYAYYVAINAGGARVSEDVENHTLYWDSGAAVAEVTNTPEPIGTTGEYKVLLTAAETNVHSGKLVGVSATTGVEIVGCAYTFNADPVQAVVEVTLEDGDGAAVEGAAVAVLDDAGRQVAAGETDASGAVRLTISAGGRFTLTASKSGLVTKSMVFLKDASVGSSLSITMEAA